MESENKQQNKPDENIFCLAPFIFAEVGNSGELYCCCPSYTDLYSFGNVFEKGFESVWYGEKATKFRQDILDGKYTHCHREFCEFYEFAVKVKNIKKYPKIPPYPKIVNFSYDNNCNAACLTCRDSINLNDEKFIKKFDELIEPVLLPILKKARIFLISGGGECLVSKHSRKLIKAAAKKYPKLKFRLFTNGICCDEKNLKELGIDRRIGVIMISIPAVKKETYDKIVRGGDYDRVIKNLEYISEQKRKGVFEQILVNYVVESLNFREMKAAVKLAEELDIMMNFFEFRNWHSSQMCEEYEKYAVFKEGHPEFEEFSQMMKDPIFKSQHCMMNDLLKHFTR